MVPHILMQCATWRAALDSYKIYPQCRIFHGMLEIVDRDTPVTVFVGEDAQRSLSERVVNSCRVFVQITQ